MTLSFANKKQLRFVITLGAGTFGSSSNNQITLEGFRASVNIDRGGFRQMGTLRAQIFGVSQPHMNSITTLRWSPTGGPAKIIQNFVEVYAIDGAQQTLIYIGDIVNAWGNYTNQPEVYLEIQAQAAYYNQLTPVAPRSFNGQIDVASVMSQIANSILVNGQPMTFENNGVTTQIANVYLANTGLQQAQTLANMAGVDLYIYDNIFAITPKHQPRNTQNIPVISSTTGLKGYPTFDGVGVNLQTKFNPAIEFGKLFQLNSSITIPQANGQFRASSIAHFLESQKDNGSWFTTVRGLPAASAGAAAIGS
jgi:hypothetical protein